MDLYADLPVSADGSGTTAGYTIKPRAQSWAASKMLAARQRKLQTPVRPSPAVVVKKPLVEASSDTVRGNRENDAGSSSQGALGGATAVTSAPLRETSLALAPTAGDAGFEHVEDPYDPARPNDYVTYCEMRIERRRQEEREKEYKETLRRQDEERKRLEEERMATIRRIQAEAASSGTAVAAANAAAALPSVGGGRGRGRGVSNLPAWLTQQQQQQQKPADNGGSTQGRVPLPGGREGDGRFADPEQRQTDKPSAGRSSQGDYSSSGGAAFASRVMAGMGYKEGLGLGRDQQGISKPLQAQAVGNGQGVVGLHADDRKRAAADGAAAAAAPRRKRGLFTNPTCVLLLKNMVGPGEVDENLADETKAECEKYGPISSCAVFEVTGDSELPQEERVRTFVHFERQESAVKAFRDLNGRFFGGRQIAASFYDEMKFMMGELAPT